MAKVVKGKHPHFIVVAQESDEPARFSHLLTVNGVPSVMLAVPAERDEKVLIRMSVKEFNALIEDYQRACHATTKG